MPCDSNFFIWDTCQRLPGRKNWVCPDGVPSPVPTPAQRAVLEGYAILRWQRLGRTTEIPRIFGLHNV